MGSDDLLSKIDSRTVREVSVRGEDQRGFSEWLERERRQQSQLLIASRMSCRDSGLLEQSHAPKSTTVRCFDGSITSVDSVMCAVRRSNQREIESLDIISLLVLIGIFSCVSVIYTNSRKNKAKMDEIVDLLRKIADKS
jgi:hypothetical protein